MRPVLENKSRTMDDREGRDELSEEHVQAAVEEKTSQADLLGLRSHVCRLSG